MNIRLICTAAAAIFSLVGAVVGAVEKKSEWTAEFKDFNGKYLVYSGSLSELQPPTPMEKHVSVWLSGPAARDLFNQIGPDLKHNESCSLNPGYRERRKGHLDCVYTKEDGYECSFGIDLRSGKSMYGSIC